MRPSGAPNGGTGGLLIKLVVLTFYLGLNISLNMLNKWVLSHYGFRFPLLMSLCHMAFSFFTLAPIMLLKSFREQHTATLQKQWLGLLGVGIFFAVNIGFNNVSLVSISLSLNQVIRCGGTRCLASPCRAWPAPAQPALQAAPQAKRQPPPACRRASIPIVTAVGAIFIESKSPTRQEFLSLIILASGVGVAVWEGSDSKSSFDGILLCLIGGRCQRSASAAALGSSSQPGWAPRQPRPERLGPQAAALAFIGAGAARPRARAALGHVDPRQRPPSRRTPPPPLPLRHRHRLQWADDEHQRPAHVGED
jgi:hypothetical protein